MTGGISISDPAVLEGSSFMKDVDKGEQRQHLVLATVEDFFWYKLLLEQDN